MVVYERGRVPGYWLGRLCRSFLHVRTEARKEWQDAVLSLPSVVKVRVTRNPPVGARWSVNQEPVLGQGPELTLCLAPCRPWKGAGKG